jgi:hypothetical protein
MAIGLNTALYMCADVGLRFGTPPASRKASA